MFFVDFVGLADYNRYFNSSNNNVCLGAPCDIISNDAIRKAVRLLSSDTALNILPISIQKIWRKAFLKYGEISGLHDGICFMFNAHYYWMIRSGMIQYIKKNVEKSYIVFYFSDKIQMYEERYPSFPNLTELNSVSDLIFTYNVIDAERYHLLVPPPVFPSFPCLPADKNYSSDIFFVGKNKGRLPFLIDIYDKCKSVGLDCRFVVSDVPFEQQVQRDGITYKRIPYSEVLKYVRNTKCIINVVQGGAQGITMREYEAFFYNKYLLTDNNSLFDSPLYRAEQVFRPDERIISSLKKIIYTPLTPHILVEEYSQSNYYGWVERMCTEKEEAEVMI